MSAPRIVEVGDDQARPWLEAVARGFHEDVDGTGVHAGLAATPLSRRLGALVDGRVVATLGVIDLQLAVPGGARLPCAGVTMVVVDPTWRRRGLLRGLLERALADAAVSGQPVAALFASETPIYPRFGFGPSAPLRTLRIARAHARFRDPVTDLPVVAADVEEALAGWPVILDRLGRTRPGAVSRPRRLWDGWLRHDPPSQREGGTARRLVHVPDRGYLAYRVHPSWDDALPAGRVVVEELVATDPEAERALWQHVCDLDLTTTIEAPLRPADDLLPLLVEDPLRVTAAPVSPLYTRLLDVPACLEARTYAADGAVTVAVAEPGGQRPVVWRLEVEGGRGRVQRASGDADLTLPASELAAVWLGGQEVARRRDAGRLVEHAAGAAVRLDRLLSTDRRPWTPFEF